MNRYLERFLQRCLSGESHNYVLVKLHPITFYKTVFLGNARFLGWMPLFVFFGLPTLSCSPINGLILGCLWLLVFVLNNTLILGIWCSAISHLPGCFCPWTFSQNIGFNMVPSDPLCYVTSSYTTWIFCRGVSGFRTDCPCGVWCRGLINHLPPVRWSTFWKSTFKQQLGCWFDIADSIYFFCILTYAIIYVLIHHIIFRLYLYFLNIVPYFLSTPVLTFSIDVVFILSIDVSQQRCR